MAPDYIFVHKSVKDKLLKQMTKQIRRMFGTDPCRNEEYPKMINEKHYERVLGLTKDAHVVCGGGSRKETLQIEPYYSGSGKLGSIPVMQEEIFGPVLPVLTFYDLEEVVAQVTAD